MKNWSNSLWLRVCSVVGLAQGRYYESLSFICQKTISQVPFACFCQFQHDHTLASNCLCFAWLIPSCGQCCYPRKNERIKKDSQTVPKIQLEATKTVNTRTLCRKKKHLWPRMKHSHYPIRYSCFEHIVLLSSMQSHVSD